MKLKKKGKKDEVPVVISEPLNVVSENGAKLHQSSKTAEKNENKKSRNLSKDSRRSSRSSLPSTSIEGSYLDDSDFDSDEDFSDIVTDEEITIGPDSAIIQVEKPSKPKKQRDPIVNSCCGFCSLGAGSLLTGLMYIVSCMNNEL